MKKLKVTTNIIKERKGYSAYALIKHNAVFSEGKTLEKIKLNFLDALNLTFSDKGLVYTLNDIEFQYDLASFFEQYKIINAKALSENIGMNQSLLSQYIRGIKTPSSAQRGRILNGIKLLGKELTRVEFV